MNDVDEVLQRQLLRILRIELDVRLGVVLDELQRPAEQTAGLVDLSHPLFHRRDHGDARGGDRAGLVEQAADLDRIVAAEGVARGYGRARQCRSSGQ